MSHAVWVTQRSDSKSPFFFLLDISDSLVGQESACYAGDPSSIPGLGRSSGEGIGYPLQYSWPSLVAQMVKIHLQCGRAEFNPWVGKIPWRRAWQLTAVFLPGESQWQRRLTGYSPCSRKESDMHERLSTAQHNSVSKSIHINILNISISKIGIDPALGSSNPTYNTLVKKCYSCIKYEYTGYFNTA